MTTAVSTAARAPKQPLVQQYRPLGSAAVVAAVMFIRRRGK